MADTDKQGMLLTNAGAALLARVLNGEKLVFTRGAFGDSMKDGKIVTPDTAEQAELEHLINERLSLPLIKITPTGAYAELDMQVISAQVAESFMVSEIGLFAKIGEEEEQLYGYFHAGLKGDYMPAKYSSIAKDYVYTVVIVIGNAENVTAIINRTDYELPVATSSVLGGIMVSDDFTIEPNGKLHLAQSDSLPVATESVLGGVMLSDEFYMKEINDTNATDGKLRLSGLVRSSVSIRGGLSVRDYVALYDGTSITGHYTETYLTNSTVSLTSGSIHLADENIYLKGANGKRTSIKGEDDLDVDIYLPNVKLNLGSAAASIPASIRANTAKVSLDSASIRANDATIFSSANNHTLTFDTKTEFKDAVSITIDGAKGGLDATRVSLHGAVKFSDATVTANSLSVAENYCTIQATHSDIDLTQSTIRGVPSLASGFSVGGTAKFTGVADFRDATVKGIDSGGGDVTITGITNPFNGVLSLTSGEDSLDGGKIIMGTENGGSLELAGYNKGGVINLNVKDGMMNNGGKIIMGGESSSPDETGGSIEGDVHFSGKPVFQSGFLAKTGDGYDAVTIESADGNGGVIDISGESYQKSGGTLNAHGSENGGVVSLRGWYNIGGTIDASGYYKGGSISLSGGTDPFGGNNTVSGDGGTIDMHGTYKGGVISLGGGYQGGTIDASGSDDDGTGGVINLSGANKGGKISLCGVEGGSIDASGSDDGTGGTIKLSGGQQGGSILASGREVGSTGGTINISGFANGGTIDASGRDVNNGVGGTIDLKGNGQGGVIDMGRIGGGTGNGSIKGAPFLTDGLRIGSDGSLITRLFMENSKLKIVYNNTTYTFTPDA